MYVTVLLIAKVYIKLNLNLNITPVKSNIFKMHLFHTPYSSNLLIYLLTYLLSTDIQI